MADLNCLKKLLRFVLRAAFSTADIEGNGDDSLLNGLDVDRNVFAGANKECDFRIDVQVIGRTVVLMRREMEHRGRAMGFGVGYLDACTKPYEADPSAAGPHKRVTFVKFGNLRLLLRHKTLATIYPETAKGNQQLSAPNGGGGDNNAWPSSVGYSAVRYVRGGYLVSIYSMGIGVCDRIGPGVLWALVPLSDLSQYRTDSFPFQGDHNALTQIEFASVSKERGGHLVIDKWLDMLFIGSDHLYLGEHIRGRFQEPTMRRRVEALELSGMKPSDGRRVLFILESVLEKIIQYGRRSGDGSRGGKSASGGGGDGKRRHGPVTNEPVSFSIVSRDECRKLLLYKNGPAKGKSTTGVSGKQSDTPPLCVSDAMMAALLADDGRI